MLEKLSLTLVSTSRRFVIGLASVLATGILVILFYSIFLSFTGAPSWYIQDFGGDRDFESDEIKIVYGINTPDLNKSAQVRAGVSQIWIPNNFIENGKEYCNFRVRYAELVRELPARSPSQYWGYGFRSYGSSGNKFDRCFTSVDSGIWALMDEEVAQHVGGVPPYYFPFDTMKIKGLLWLEADDRTADATNQIVKFSPKIVGYAFAPNWSVDIRTTNVTNGDTGTILEATYRRPLIYVALTPILLLIIVFAIVALLFVNETSSFLEVLVGLLFGIWGIRQVLIPSFVTWTTIVDSLLLVSYGLIGFVILVRLTLVYAQSISIRQRQSTNVYRRVYKKNRNLH